MASFFAMGGYAVYVWPAYIISALVLAAAIVVSLQSHSRAKKSVRMLEEDSAQNGESQK
ncbi:MAG TPA: heme exporter protein CcmD [Micropepsaceae bacterium]|jgi:heme exporter protein D|nr:heme exporter protein CcmD [Micropepsaceae bacterium]